MYKTFVQQGKNYGFSVKSSTWGDRSQQPKVLHHFMKLVENNEVFKWHPWKNYDTINLVGELEYTHDFLSNK